MLRRIGFACSVMNSLQRIWKCSYLSTSTEVHLYQSLMSVLLADIGTLEAFQRQMLNIHWWDHIYNVEMGYYEKLYSPIMVDMNVKYIQHVTSLTKC